MLENIKSTYFKKIIFSLLDENAKLKILRYNKNLQKLLDIQIINYFIFTQKYIIKEANEFSKTYIYNPYYEDIYEDKLIFEGQYLNGLKNGKCKEYDAESGIIQFEGEYLNGLRIGKGKEYYTVDKLKFEGEYLNGERNGKGKEYTYEGSLSFEGEYLNGEINGKGKEYNQDSIIEGQYLNGKRNGKCKEYSYDDYLICECDFLNGRRNGKEKEYYSN